MVEGMYVVVNVTLSLMSVMSPPPALCNISVNYDDICMCVVNKQFEHLKFVLIPFMLTCSMIRFLSLLVQGLCACMVSVVMWSSLVCM